ncbi:MAG: hypothetical protein LBT74_11075 [Acidobacteriota bacterium]|jgi:hypothetical protein|nr:hypothetical protein [Acidobacteriota bacterium]
MADDNNIEMTCYSVPNKNEEIFNIVEEIANDLLRYLNRPEVLDAIYDANQPGSNSKDVQDVFLRHLSTIGFSDEKTGLFANYKNKLLRPDYYLKIKDSGIIFEVERGKTIMNNMDMLDLWKCHICDYADYLFLAVPKMLKHNREKKGYNAYQQVCNRLSSFFSIGNYTNVKGLFIFGY